MSRAGAGSDRPPRVLILLENAAIPYDRRVMAEATALLEAGYAVTIICPTASHQPAEETIDGILVRRYTSRPSRGGAVSQVAEYVHALVQTLALMLRLWREPGFDVIHACNPPDLFFLLAAVFKPFGVRFIFDQHDLAPELYSALYGRDSGLIMRALQATEWLSYRTADAVITVNESYRRLAIQRGGVDPNRVFVVRNGPREGWPRVVAADPSLRRGRQHLAVYLGVMGEQDGVDVLLSAISFLIYRLHETDTTFALVGDGSARPALEECARDLGIAHYVDFVGWVRDEDLMSAYLATADVCVSPEPSSPLNDHSTFIKVMEYMAAGKPVVAFDLPETRVSAGDAALYAAPGDVARFATLLLRVLRDTGVQECLRASALARVGDLRFEGQIPALLSAYEVALGGVTVAAGNDELEAASDAETRVRYRRTG